MDMQTNNSNIGETAAAKKPPVLVTVVAAIAAALSALIIPEFGALAMAVLAVCVLFCVSAKAHVIVQLIPVLGLVGAYLRDGALMLGVAGALWLAALIAGAVLARGGDFHRALMTFTLILSAAAVIAATLYTRMNGISAEDISEAAKVLFHDTMADAVESLGQSLPLDTANLLIEQYEAVAYTAVMYAPAAVGCMAALLGVIAIRFAGLLHGLSGCTVYPAERRGARVDRIFAVIYLISLFLGSFDTGIVGACAANVMLILMIPASAAGVTAYRLMLRRRRESGVRGVPFSLLMLILSFVLFSPVVGLMILAFTGVFSAFAKSSARSR